MLRRAHEIVPVPACAGRDLKTKSARFRAPRERLNTFMINRGVREIPYGVTVRVFKICQRMRNLIGPNGAGESFASRNGKPGATRGRKTSGLIEIAGLPNGVQDEAARLVRTIGAYWYFACHVGMRFGERPGDAGVRRADDFSATGDVLLECGGVRPLDTGCRPVRPTEGGWVAERR